jgi:Reverse transcriptase (RNA-dependent DNA polymerase)
MPQISTLTSQKYLKVTKIQTHSLSSSNFNSLQSAYRPHYVTETALNLTLNDTRNSVSSGPPISLVTLDLSAAIVTITHSILLSRLSDSFDVSGTVMLHVALFISDRAVADCTLFGNFSSSKLDFLSGVPQGSVLGSILFSANVSPVYCIH